MTEVSGVNNNIVDISSSVPNPVTDISSGVPNPIPEATSFQMVNSRNIGGFVADVTISEEHFDEVTITDHPVEQGANVSDHAFANPVRVVITVGYSDQFGEDHTVEAYRNFLTLKNARQPFKITTGKRQYNNMLIQAIGVLTNNEFENSGIFTVTCREVIMVATGTTTVPSAAVMDQPQATGAPQNRGLVNAVPASPSANSQNIPPPQAVPAFP